MLTPFETLLVTHLVADWILGQTDWEAQNKAKNWRAAMSHASKWWLLIGLAVIWIKWPEAWTEPMGPVVWVLPLMGLLHAFIDRRWPVLWLIKVKEYLPGGRPDLQREPPFWLVICIDQVLHVVQVAIIAACL